MSTSIKVGLYSYLFAYIVSSRYSFHNVCPISIYKAAFAGNGGLHGSMSGELGDCELFYDGRFTLETQA